MARQYKIKKRYGLKGLPDGWHVYSRYIVPGKGRGLSYKRRRISGPFATRRGAIRAAKNLKKKLNAIIMTMVKKDEIPK